MNNYNSNINDINDNKQPNNINFVNNKKTSKNSLEQKQVEGKEEIFKNTDNYELGNENNLNNLNDNNNININNENIKVIKSKNLNENQNNNRINSILSINNNNFAQNHLETVLETFNEVSCSRFDSSKLSDNNSNDNGNGNKNKNINNNIIDINNSNFKENNELKQKTKDEAIIISEQKIQYSENNTTALATLAANNTKKSLYLFKSEKTD